jgi:hypothetical protein
MYMQVDGSTIARFLYMYLHGYVHRYTNCTYVQHVHTDFDGTTYVRPKFASTIFDTKEFDNSKLNRN